MQFDKPLVCFDFEATGPDAAQDRIVQIGFLKVYLDGIRQEECYLVNPGRPIPPRATEIHKITDDMVKNSPSFKEHAPYLFQALQGCDLVGFNLQKFDIPLLWEEFYRAGITWDLEGVRVFDAATIFTKKNPRTLEAAVKTYLGESHDGAHDALADAIATMRVFEQQLKAHDDIATMNQEELAAFCKWYDNIDLAGKLVRNEKGEAVYNFGKVKGTRVVDDIGYAYWMLDRDFSANTKMHLKRIISERPTTTEPF